MLSHTITNEERSGWNLVCPQCAGVVPYTVLTIHGGREPFLYCDTCSNFVLRREDADKVAQLIGDQGFPSVAQMRTIYLNLEHQLPASPCGGHFRIWANVKCINCNYEFPYNNGVKHEMVRFFDPKVIGKYPFTE